MKKLKKLIPVFAILFVALIVILISEIKIVESGTVLKRDTVQIERSEINMSFLGKE